jgi:hypothetical protein
MTVATMENDGDKLIGCCTRFIKHAAMERGDGYANRAGKESFIITFFLRRRSVDNKLLVLILNEHRCWPMARGSYGRL